MEEIVMSLQPFSEVVDTAAFRSDVGGMIVNPWLSRFEGITKQR
jgi:peptide/nickel transport system substrate-binding protein